jgi:flavorubredoxin
MAELEDLNDVFGTYFVNPKFPRPIADGVQWIGGCSALFMDKAKQDLVHSALNTYLIIGSEKTLLIDTSHPALWHEYKPALAKALNGRKLDYVMPTHPEIPHAGSLTMLVEAHPDVKVVGDTRDYFLYHPDVPESAYLPMGPGDKLDLGGGRIFEFVESIFRDLVNTIWAFDHGSRTLFPADGFAFFHWHNEGGCGCTAEELGLTPTAEMYSVMTQIVSGISLLDVESRISRFEALVERLQPKILAPAHGTVVTDVPNAMTYMEALRKDSRNGDRGVTGQ